MQDTPPCGERIEDDHEVMQDGTGVDAVLTELLTHKPEPEARKRSADIRSALPQGPEETELFTEEGMLGADKPRRKRVRRARKPRTKTGNE